ncbi:MAG: hypothetical protein V1835_02800 [Candidatus Micrarchaeota archaeon]
MRWGRQLELPEESLHVLEQLERNKTNFRNLHKHIGYVLGIRLNSLRSEQERRKDMAKEARLSSYGSAAIGVAAAWALHPFGINPWLKRVSEWSLNMGSRLADGYSTTYAMTQLEKAQRIIFENEHFLHFPEELKNTLNVSSAQGELNPNRINAANSARTRGFISRAFRAVTESVPLPALAYASTEIAAGKGGDFGPVEDFANASFSSHFFLIAARNIVAANRIKKRSRHLENELQKFAAEMRRGDFQSSLPLRDKALLPV